jgi:hypothetical protein
MRHTIICLLIGLFSLSSALSSFYPGTHFYLARPL